MINPQLLVFDLDGTLLDSSHQIPPSAHELLLAFRQAGLETTIATGRPFASAQRFMQALELTLPVILFNGAAVIGLSMIRLDLNGSAESHPGLRKILHQ